MNRLKPCRWGDLEALDSHADFQTSLTQQAMPVMVVLHGYGADMSDLAALAPGLSLSSRPMRWIFLNGPHRVPIGPGWEGRAWFPLRMADLERIQRESGAGSGLDLSEQVPEGMASSRRQVLAALKAAGAPLENCVFAGFSQGAMLATELALRVSEGPRALVVLSGSLVNAAAWRTQAELRATQPHRVPVFQSHGVSDPVLALAPAKRLREEIFQLANWPVQSVEFRGGHEIPLEVTSQLRQFLERNLAGPPFRTARSN
jgi:phospholipase/carboxylesterase